MNAPTDQHFEQAARLHCLIRGQDPDAQRPPHGQLLWHSVAARLRETYAHEAAMTLLREAAAASPNPSDEWHGPIDGPLKVLARTEAEAQDVAMILQDSTMTVGRAGVYPRPYYLRKGSPIARANGLENFLDT